MDFTTVLCDQFHLQPWQVNNVIQLLDEGNTIPFIARYRKEAHGTLDDQVIRELSERLDYLRNLQKRKEEVGEAIAAQEAMTGELQAALDAAATLAEVEDIYRPYRPKRMTRATKAKERGLEPFPSIWRRNLSTRKRKWKPRRTLYPAPWTLSRRKSPTTRASAGASG